MSKLAKLLGNDPDVLAADLMGVVVLSIRQGWAVDRDGYPINPEHARQLGEKLLEYANHTTDFEYREALTLVEKTKVMT